MLEVLGPLLENLGLAYVCKELLLKHSIASIVENFIQRLIQCQSSLLKKYLKTVGFEKYLSCVKMILIV